MADAYEELDTAISNNSSDNIIKNLKLVLSNQTVEFKDTAILPTLLKSESTEIIKLTSQAIAESGKTSNNREKLSERDLIELLLDILSKNENNACLTQVCRALGNICYENEKAVKIIKENQGTKTIICTLEDSLKIEDSTNNQLTKVTCGLLSNYLVSSEDAQKEAIALGIIPLVERAVEKKIDQFSSCEDLFMHLLQILSILTEQMVDTWFSEELIGNLVKILEVSINPVISEFCLELLAGQAENDDIKYLLAQKGLCELLYNLLEQHKSLVSDEESRALLKQACDLIVLILTEDKSMWMLYDEGRGNLYQDMLSWLESEDVDLMITGVLAVGNFARNDEHTIKMVESGLSETLLGILSQHNKASDDRRLQYALLSALRNLVIPAQNKSRMISNGLVDIILPMLSIEQYPVIFKLLGTLRMVIAGQEKTALQVLMKSQLLERLVDFCFNSDHPGVRAESPRLLAWLIKHCHSSEPYPYILKVQDSVKCLVEMIPSPHAVMQNEALLALNLLCIFEKSDKTNLTDNEKEMNNTNVSLENIFVDSDIGKYIAFLLSKYHDKIEREIFENLLTFLEKICEYVKVKENLKSNEVSKGLQSCLDREEFKTLEDRINKITNDIDSG